MTFDYTVKLTDVVMIVALVIGPIAAVQLTEWLRRKEEIQKRQKHVFRTLMATRTTTLHFKHIEAMNLNFINNERSWIVGNCTAII